jgi:hypothetical protein
MDLVPVLLLQNCCFDWDSQKIPDPGLRTALCIFVQKYSRRMDRDKTLEYFYKKIRGVIMGADQTWDRVYKCVYKVPVVFLAVPTLVF